MEPESRYDYYSNEGRLIVQAWDEYISQWYDFDTKISFFCLVFMTERFLQDCFEDFANIRGWSLYTQQSTKTLNVSD